MGYSLKISPDDLTEGFKRLGLEEGDSVMLHASLDGMGIVEGGAAMVLHRLLGVIGEKGTLLMPAFTSVTRHSTTHCDFTIPGCWCEGVESRHIPFIPEPQPDKEIGTIAHRLCSWPNSRRSKHPSHSFVSVGNYVGELVREISLDDPLLPVKKMFKHNPCVVTIGVGLNAITSIYLAMEKISSQKIVKERALMMLSKGPVWVEVRTLGYSRGFERLRPTRI